MPSVGQNSPIRASLDSEQQTLVLVGIPDHTVGQALGASVKPISVVPCSLTVYHFSWTLVRSRAWITVGEQLKQPKQQSGKYEAVMVYLPYTTERGARH